ncbi:MAG: hybrid sensor histidine kinase/response regulator [Labilithrix sp.]|nr:hybrid sensor histidine kinase/response regulator [Labilithrix sp.]
MTEPEHRGDPHTDLAGVLHDVSNALTVLLGWVSEARAPGATPEAVAYALTIVEQRARIARDLARHAIGSPRFDEQRELGAIVEEVAQALKVEAQRKGARVVVRGAEEEAKVAGALDVSQVLTNLILNALAYAPSGTHVNVTITVDDARCGVLVADDGPGVEAHRRERIFQGDSMRPGGAGVGLRHSRDLARAWGGDVELVPHEGGGARFRVTWPRVDAVPRPPVSTSRVSDLSGMHVLVVEDDLAVRQLLEAALDARGAAVTIAATASELTACLTKSTFHAVLVDLSPIAGDAPGAIAAIRARCPDATLVVITGNADALPEAVVAETVELVRKPFEVREIFAVLGRAAAPKKQA